MSYFDQVNQAADVIKSKVSELPKVAIVLGSGLGDFAGTLSDAVCIPYKELPHWPVSNVVGHAGQLVIGRCRGLIIAALAGRCHLYEGHSASTVTFGVRVLGMRDLILTNAAGGVNTGFSKGALMVIDDHINLTGHNPLVGMNEDRFGPRFPDMTQVYSRQLRHVAGEAGKQLQLALPHGVYAALLGPSYETPAEIRYLRTIGADAVGMSTVPEAIVARHMKMEVLGISCITNMAAGVLPQPIDHSEVMETTTRIRGQFIALLEGIIGQL